MQVSLTKQWGEGMMSIKKIEVRKMLLEFSCSNHKSIKEEVKFSMIAGKDKTYEEYLKDFGNHRVLRSAVIYGANGSGKSNFLRAFSFMQELVTKSIYYQPGEKVWQVPHKLSTEETPSEYHIQFVKNDIRYAYGFSIKQNEVEEEYLYSFPKGKQVIIFERTKMSVQYGDKYKTTFNTVNKILKEILKENRLFLSCAASYSSIKEVEEVFLFFRNDIVVYNSTENNWEKYSAKLMQEDKQIRNLFLTILQALGADVKDIKVRLEELPLSGLPISLYSLEEQMLMQKKYIIDAKMVYDQFEVDLEDESDGIQRLFEMICPIIDILKNGKILLCDEIESSLHETIIFQLVQFFQSYEIEKFAQLIFSTHNTSLLNMDLFRRDQIWFTQLNEERATDLYSLVEVKNVRKFENLEKGYVSGKYGGIPILNKDFFKLLKDNTEDKG